MEQSAMITEEWQICDECYEWNQSEQCDSCNRKQIAQRRKLEDQFDDLLDHSKDQRKTIIVLRKELEHCKQVLVRFWS